MSTDPHDFYEALEHLDSLDLPFQLVEASEEDEFIALRVASAEVDLVVAYFDEHPFTLPDGSTKPVTVSGRAGSWITEPVQDWTGEPDPLPLHELVGLDVRDAARRASQSGWLVRAYEPEAVLTADMRPGRLNLGYSTEDIVTRADIG